MKVGVIGATGLVGQRIIDILSQCDVEVIPLGRKVSRMIVGGRYYQVYDVETYDLGSLDGVMMSINSEDALRHQKDIKGWIIDNSTAHYGDKSVPKVVSEIYQGKRERLVVSPNCVAIPIALVLDVIVKQCDIKSCWGSTYQSISGAGKRALEAYEKGLGLYNTVMPVIGDIQSGISEEEGYIIDSVKQALGIDITMSMMAVRVPVSIGHGIHLKVECEDVISYKILEKFKDCPYIHYDESHIATNLDVIGKSEVYLSRVKIEGNTLDMWVMSDNLMRGAAWNMCAIAKMLFGVTEKKGEYEKTN